MGKKIVVVNAGPRNSTWHCYGKSGLLTENVPRTVTKAFKDAYGISEIKTEY